jgi:nicotinate-nucleotide adenylyltransferase
MNKVGLFGGTFDPIHRGHVEPVLSAVEELGLDRVVYLPTARPPHKSHREFAPALARFAMVELALLDHDLLTVSDFEMDLTKPSYAMDTVEHFHAVLPDTRLYYIVGSDAFPDLPRWHRGGELLELVDIVVLSRPRATLDELLSAVGRGDKAALERARVHPTANLQVDISSTRLRQALTEDRDSELTSMLHPRVLRYIRKYSLYRPSDD